MFKTDKLQASVDRLGKDYGDDWLGWLPETLAGQVNRHYGGVEDIDRDRILAARNLITEGQFWTTLDIFSATILAFNWVDADMGMEVRPSPGQIVLGTKMAYDLAVKSGQDPGNLKFEDSVKSYIAAIFIDRGYVFVPPEFGAVGDIQEYLNRYFCNPVLSGAVEAKWRSMMDHSWPDLEENEVDVQSGKLLALKKFMDIGGVSRQRSKIDALHKIILE